MTLPLTVGLSILVSGAFGSVQLAPIAPIVHQAPVAKAKPSARALTAGAVMSSQPDPAVQAAVADYFSDIPVMIRIADCESNFHQFDLNGNVLMSVTNDIGVMQINEYTHADAAVTLGYNLATVSDNMAYARRLYNRSGTAPWLSSSRCWAGDGTVATTVK